MRPLLVIFAVALAFLPVSATAQRYKKGRVLRQHKQLFPRYPQYKQTGWYLGPGATYMLPNFGSDNRTLLNTDTLQFNADVEGGGRFGVAFEAGRFHILSGNSLVQLMDYGLSYKMLRGKEDLAGTLTTLDALGNPLVTPTEAENTYTEHFVSANFNLHNIIQLSDYKFLQNTVGVNVDYGLARSTNTGAAAAGADQEFPPSVVAQLHYRIGFGFKVNDRMMVIPGIETPILNVNPLEAKSTLEYFSSRYRPLIFYLRFMFFRPTKDPACEPIRTPDGFRMPTDMEEVR